MTVLEEHYKTRANSSKCRNNGKKVENAKILIPFEYYYNLTENV